MTEKTLTDSQGHLYSSCLRKTRFKQKNFADRVAEEKGKQYGQNLRAYFCRFCAGWHLTTKPAYIKNKGEA